jgi:hypothetical protein
MTAWRLIALVAALGACGGACGGTSAPPSDGGDASDGGADTAADLPQPGGYALPEFPGGNTFFIQLPPSFSPFLPLTGEEATREPPGFYDPASPYLFSYGFIWWLTGTPDLSTAALQANLRNYYVGACPSQTVTATLGEPAAATATADAGAGVLVARRAGTLETGTCFGNPVGTATLDVSTYDCPDHAAVIVMVSPQPASSQVWTDLRAIRDGFNCW